MRQAQFANWVDNALQNRRPSNSVQMLGNPEAVLWDKQLNNLLYIYPDSADSRIKIIINTSWNVKKLQPLDTVINAFKLPVQNLNEGAYDTLQGGILRQEK